MTWRPLILLAGLTAALLALGAVFAFLPDPDAVHLGRALSPPGPGGLLGTDELGRSLLLRLLGGARFSLPLMVAAGWGAVLLGTSLGVTAGWIGGVWDHAVGVAVSVFWSIPMAVFAILALTIVTPGLGSMIATIVLVNWVGSARVLRTATRDQRACRYVTAARARGVPTSRILLEEVFPNLAGLTALLAGFSTAEALALEGALAFVGAGPAPPTATWGASLASGAPYFAAAWWIPLMPAAAMLVAIGVARFLSARAQEALFR